MIWEADCSRLPNDEDSTDNHSSCGVVGDSESTKEAGPIGPGSFDQIEPKAVEPSKNVRSDSDKTAVLSMDGEWS